MIIMPFISHRQPTIYLYFILILVAIFFISYQGYFSANIAEVAKYYNVFMYDKVLAETGTIYFGSINPFSKPNKQKITLPLVNNLC